MSASATVPSPVVRTLSVGSAPPAAVAVPLQPGVVQRPVVITLSSRPAEAVRRTTLAEAQRALQRLGRRS